MGRPDLTKPLGMAMLTTGYPGARTCAEYPGLRGFVLGTRASTVATAGVICRGLVFCCGLGSLARVTPLFLLRS